MDTQGLTRDSLGPTRNEMLKEILTTVKGSFGGRIIRSMITHDDKVPDLFEGSEHFIVCLCGNEKLIRQTLRFVLI